VAAASALRAARAPDGALSGERPESLDAAALEVSAALRHRGRWVEARALLDTVSEASDAVELERALLAFASGDDEAVRAIAEERPSLRGLVAPLVAAADAEPPPKRAPSGSTETLKGLYAAARAIARADDPAAAQRTVAAIPCERVRVPLETAHRLLHEEPFPPDLLALEKLDPGPLARVARLAVARGEPVAGLALAAELDDAELRHHALWHLSHHAPSDHLLEETPATQRESVLERPRDAPVHEGFADLAAGDLEAARAAFDEGLEAGGDLIECLRGRWLVLGVEVRRAPNVWLAAWAPAARALAKALSKDPRHAAARLAVELDAVIVRAEHEVDLDAALADVRRVRDELSAWIDTRAVRCMIDRAEARVHLARGDRALAAPLAERALREDPDSARSWLLAIDLASADEVPDLARRAFEATGDDCFRPHLAGGATPGALAVAVRDAAEPELGETLARAHSAMDAMVEPDRGYAEEGVLHVLMSRELREPAAAFVSRRFDAPATDRLLLAKACLSLDLVEPVEAMLSARESELDTSELADLVVIGSSEGQASFAMKLLGRLQPRLTRRELGRLRRRLGEPDFDPVVEAYDRALDALHDALHPELCLHELDPDPPSAPAPFPSEDAFSLDEEAIVDGLLAGMMQDLDLPLDLLGDIPLHRKREFLDGTLLGAPSVAQMKAMLARLLGDVAPSRRPRPPRRRHKTKRKKRKGKKKR